MDEVMSLLKISECINMEDYLDHLRMVRINNRKKDNGQVIITCPFGESDNRVAKLTRFEGRLLTKLYSYTNKEVQVKFSYPTIGIEKWILKTVLKEYSVRVLE